MCFFVGFFGLALLPVGLDFAVEITYPMPEAISSGLMLTSCNIFGSIFSISGSVLIGALPENHEGTKISMISFTVFAMVASTIFFFVKQDLRRIAMQEQLKEYTEKEDKTPLLTEDNQSQSAVEM